MRNESGLQVPHNSISDQSTEGEVAKDLLDIRTGSLGTNKKGQRQFYLSAVFKPGEKWRTGASIPVPLHAKRALYRLSSFPLTLLESYETDLFLDEVEGPQA